jgi:hypothetical protein
MGSMQITQVWHAMLCMRYEDLFMEKHGWSFPRKKYYLVAEKDILGSAQRPEIQQPRSFNLVDTSSAHNTAEDQLIGASWKTVMPRRS